MERNTDQLYWAWHNGYITDDEYNRQFHKARAREMERETFWQIQGDILGSIS